MKYEQEMQAGIAAIREATRICRRVQASVSSDVVKKKDRSPVTVADFASQAVICYRLGQSFPDDAVIAEESSAELRGAETAIRERVVSEVAQVLPQADESLVFDAIDRGRHRDASRRFWTLDPIDGTKGFLRSEQYAIALALIEDGEIVLGILGCPNLSWRDGRGVMLTAVKGQGAVARRLNDSDSDRDEAESEAIRVSLTDEPARARFCESVESGHSDHSDAARVARALGIERDPVRLDSQAKYAVVAMGRADIYMRLPTRPGYREKIWDHAAGLLAVTEAGGRVTDIHGAELDFGAGSELKEGCGVLATNGLLHDATVAALRGRS